MDNRIKFHSFSDQEIYKAIYEASHAGSYVSYIRGKRCNTERNFFREISASFQFPFYFGENWTALDECLCDLDWLHFSGIFIVIDNFHFLFDSEVEKNILQSRVIKYLSIMTDYWGTEGTPIEVWLNRK